jgi:betaine-aldehyde dehydrogenase
MVVRDHRGRSQARGNAEDLRRRQLVEATIDTMAEVGFAATTLALIGQRAGVSPGLISHYFDDKDGLLEATLRSLAAPLAAVCRSGSERRVRRASASRR